MSAEEITKNNTYIQVLHVLLMRENPENKELQGIDLRRKIVSSINEHYKRHKFNAINEITQDVASGNAGATKAQLLRFLDILDSEAGRKFLLTIIAENPGIGTSDFSGPEISPSAPLPSIDDPLERRSYEYDIDRRASAVPLPLPKKEPEPKPVKEKPVKPLPPPKREPAEPKQVRVQETEPAQTLQPRKQEPRPEPEPAQPRKAVKPPAIAVSPVVKVVKLPKVHAPKAPKSSEQAPKPNKPAEKDSAAATDARIKEVISTIDAEPVEQQARILVKAMRGIKGIFQKDIADVVRANESSVYQWEKQGNIPPEKLGGILKAVDFSDKDENSERSRQFAQLAKKLALRVRPDIISRFPRDEKGQESAIGTQWLETKIARKEWDNLSFPALDDEWLTTQLKEIQGRLLLIAFRERQGLSRDELAEATGMSRSTIRNSESGGMPINIAVFTSPDYRAVVRVSDEEVQKLKNAVTLPLAKAASESVIVEIAPAAALAAESPVKQKGRPQRPYPIPSVSVEDWPMKEAAILEARNQFAAMEVYSPEIVAGIAGNLFRLLAALSPGETNYGKSRLLSDAIDARISLQAINEVLVGKRGLTPANLASNDVIDTWMPMLVREEKYREEVANYLTGIPLAHIEHPGHDLLHYATSHKAGIADFLRLAQCHYRTGHEEFYRDILQMEEHAYVRLSMGKCQRSIGNVDIVTQAATNLGLNEEDSLIFRKLALRMPLNVTQDTLNQCFTPGENNPYSLNAEAMGRDRAISLSRFYELLRIVRGKRDFTEMAAAICPRDDEDTVESRREMGTAIRNMSPRGGFDPEVEAGMNEQPVKTMKLHLAQKVAAYAFPEDISLQAQCIAFLSSEKYHASRTEVADKIWATRRRNNTERKL